ncbi:MAG: hypothetical protein JWR02_213 [Mucilaginibacter sp.]|nr:hypothetical protein [Mucilaginibacter sp.]
MSKTRVECPVCGSVYEFTSQSIQDIDTGHISCFVCNTIIFEYNGCDIWYPFLLNKKENHLNSNLETTGLTTDPLSDPTV